MNRPVTGLTLFVLGLIAADRLFGRDNPKPEPDVVQIPAQPLASNPPPVRRTAVTVQPAVQAAPDSTGDGGSIIAKLARLEGKRRLMFAGDAAYVDSLFTTPDSMVRRWPDGRIIRVWSAPSKVNGLDRAIQKTLDEWSDDETGIKFEHSAAEAGSDIIIELVNRLPDSIANADGPGRPERAGVADVQSTTEGEIVSARIRISMHDRQGRAYTIDQLQSVIIHEFGHALGLPHSANEEDIMYPIVKVSGVSTRDRSSIRLLYSLPTGPLREPVGSQ